MAHPRSKPLATKFCHCVKSVRKTVRAPLKTRESAAIGICTKSVLQTRGKTLRKFSCKKKVKLSTQRFPKKDSS